MIKMERCYGKYFSDKQMMYDRPFYVDSSYIIEKDTFRVTIKHYCLKDSAITVPQKYVGIYGLNTFITHSFNSSITFEKNGVMMADLNTAKSDFENYLDPSLKNYGVLLYPEVEEMNRTIKVNYSISVPLTDVGESVSVTINNEGKTSFSSR